MKRAVSTGLFGLLLAAWLFGSAPGGTRAAGPTPPELNIPFAPALAHDPALQQLLCKPDPEGLLAEDELQAPILLYHFVGRQALEQNGRSTSRFNVTATDFAAQLALLQQLGYHTVTLREIAAALRGEATLPSHPIALTFDDGWVEQYDIVFPLLQKYGMRATFFIPSTYPVGGRFITWEQLQTLADAGMEIGSHGRRHQQLTTLSTAVAADEIRRSKTELEAHLGRPVTSFSYPYGSAHETHQYLVADAGYTAAVGLGPASVQSLSRIYYLRRIEVQGTYTLADLLRWLPWRGEGSGLCNPLYLQNTPERPKVLIGF